MPNAAKNLTVKPKNAASMSYSHNQFPNHFAASVEDEQTQFEPNYVKLDKQVSLITLTGSTPPAAAHAYPKALASGKGCAPSICLLQGSLFFISPSRWQLHSASV